MLGTDVGNAADTTRNTGCKQSDTEHIYITGNEDEMIRVTFGMCMCIEVQQFVHIDAAWRKSTLRGDSLLDLTR